MSGWELDRHFAANGTVWAADGMTVCTVTDRDGGTRDMGRLIAAAPDLLEALINLAAKHRLHYGLDGAWDDELTSAEAVIARALGK